MLTIWLHHCFFYNLPISKVNISAIICHKCKTLRDCTKFSFQTAYHQSVYNPTPL